jgi:hypothetical protein
MPTVSFSSKEEVVQWWRCEAEVPQDIIDKGEAEVKQYIEDNSCDLNLDLEYISLETSDVKASMLAIDDIEMPIIEGE